MKKILKTILFLGISLICIVIYPAVRADSGYDADYGHSGSGYGGSSSDYGSSHDDHDYSWGSSSSSSSSSGSYHESSEEEEKAVKLVFGFLFVISLVIVVIVVVHSIYKYMIKKIYDKNYLDYSRYSMLETESDEYIYEKLGEDFNIEEFYEHVFKIYKDIQMAWMDRDIDRVRNVLSDEMYNTYKTEVDMLKLKKRINIMDNIEYMKSGIIDINITKKDITIETMLYVTCNDYIIDEKTQEVLRGKKKKTNYYVYNLTFKKSFDVVDTCPKCGEKLGKGSSVKCLSCKWSFVKGSEDFILVDKKMKGQW